MRQEFANMRALDLETIVPFTHVGSSTFGQLSDRFHARFDTFFDAFVERGDIAEKWRTPLRQVVMALAENGSEYGRGCSIGCFLRQEKGHAANSRERTDDVLFDPRRHTHLFINCFTLGPSLAEVTGHPTEWEAAQAVLGGFTVRQQGGGGSGMHNVMHTVVQSAKGTVYINSKNYVRMVLPDGLVREHTFGGDLYLPGVHICLLIPLAVIAELSQRKAV